MFLGRLAVVLAVDTLASRALVAADTGGSDLALLLNYGILGIVTLLWLTGRIETPKRGDKAEVRAEAAEARERALEETLRNEVVPALTRFTEVGARILEREPPPRRPAPR